LLSSAFSQRDGLNIRKEILQRIKSQVQMYLGKEPAAIRSYALSYKKDIERPRWTPSSTNELLTALAKADVVFGGDFHAFAQAQRVHLRNLRNMAPFKKVILALECVPSRHQKVLDQFMAREISEAEFLKKIQWEKHWGFPWGQYKPLFDVVRQYGGRCVALNKVLPLRTLKALHERDKHAVKILAEAYQGKKDDECIYVVYGDLHIAREKLPGLFRKTVKKFEPRVLTVYLNPEKLYFQLLKKNLESKVSVVKFSKDEFCLLESPPWVKWQSYLIFLEETMDESLLDDDGITVDYSEHVMALLKMMATDLGVHRDFEVAVYSFNDHDFLDLLGEKMNARDFSHVKNFVKNDISFYEPKSETAFLPRSTVNYAAHLAAHVFHSQLCGRQKFIGEFPADFESAVWYEGAAFYLSKLVNPHRKSLNLADLKKQLSAFSPGDGGEAALKLALDQKMKELEMAYGRRESVPARKKHSELDFHRAAKILGAMLGQRIFDASKAGRLSRSKILQWLKQPVETGKFQDFYIQILKDLDTIEAGAGYE